MTGPFLSTFFSLGSIMSVTAINDGFLSILFKSKKVIGHAICSSVLTVIELKQKMNSDDD